MAKLSMRSLQTEADVDSISLERSDQDNSYRCMSSVLDFIQSILLGFLIICFELSAFHAVDFKLKYCFYCIFLPSVI